MRRFSVLSYWGKTEFWHDDQRRFRGYHLLVHHCLDVAAVAHVLLDKDPLWAAKMDAACGVDGFSRTIPFFLALHDIGKFSLRFQAKSPEAQQRLGNLRSCDTASVHHAEMGQRFFKHHFRKPLLHGDILGKDAPPISGRCHCLNTILSTVAGHHGKPVSTPTHDCFPAQDVAAALEFCREAACLLLDDAGRRVVARLAMEADEQAINAFSFLFAGFVVLCDWMGSDTRSFPILNATPDDPAAALDVYFQNHALPAAQNAVEASGVLPPRLCHVSSFTDYFPSIVSPSPVQDHMWRFAPTGPSLVIIEDLAGGGKTEAGLVTALRLAAMTPGQTILMALPTMATANAMYDRMRTAFGALFTDTPPPSIILAHSSRDLHPGFQDSLGLASIPSTDTGGDSRQEETAQTHCSAWLSDNKKKALLASLGVCTIDQALLSVLPSKHGCLRLAGLARGVFIVDEAHAHDPYVHNLLCVLLRFHAAFGGSAVILSATLPESMRRDLLTAYARGQGRELGDWTETKAFPRVTVSCNGKVTPQALAPRPDLARTLRVDLCHDDGEMLDQAVQAAEDGAAVLWIRNTVNDARKTWRDVCSRIDPGRTTLFHARFALCDRLRIEREVMDRFGRESTPDMRRGRIVVASQVAEFSLDCDFDIPFSDIAPIDALLQRLGRGMRHLRPDASQGDRPPGYRTPRGVVLCPPFAPPPGKDWISAFLPGTAAVYPHHGRLWATARYLADHGEIRLPDDLREAIEAVYGDGVVYPHALEWAEGKARGEAMGQGLLAKFNALKPEAGYCALEAWLDERIVPTRLGAALTLRLGKIVDGRVVPWAKGATPREAWGLSELRVRLDMLGDMVPPPAELEAACELARQTMPDKGKFAALLPLAPHGGAGEWRTPWAALRGGRAIASYHPDEGFSRTIY
jgi:CRISPR-associated endonuclease/helicase Cas3